MRKNTVVYVAALVGSALALSCADDSSEPTGQGTGGALDTGGSSTSSGGSSAFGAETQTGGAAPTGGASTINGVAGTGGTLATGDGSGGTGGTVGTGGFGSPSGGSTGTGGAPRGTGGVLGTGGHRSETGGVPSTGGNAAEEGGAGSTGGGAPQTGGVPGSGGDPIGTGGVVGTGGDSDDTGGAVGTGGTTSEMGGADGTGGNQNAAGNGGESNEGGDTSPGCGSSNTTSPCAAKGTTCSLTVEGTERTYYVQLPSGYDPSTPYPVVFQFHPWGGSADQALTMYQLNSKMPDAIYVTPQGLDAGGAGAGWANTDGVDIEFTQAMVEDVQSKYCVDNDRIFSTGFSYGGMMSFAIGCEMSDVFRAIAPMAGSLYSDFNCQGTGPAIAMWGTHGTSDSVVPIEDGRAALSKILSQNHCGTETTPVEPSPCVKYQGCDPGYDVTWCEWNGDHGIPNFGSAGIAEFFQQF